MSNKTIKNKLYMDLLLTDTYEEIKEVINLMINNNMNPRKYLNTIIYRKLVLNRHNINEFNKIKDTIDLRKPIKVKGSIIEKKPKEGLINYRHNNINKPYSGGRVSPK